MQYIVMYHKVIGKIMICKQKLLYSMYSGCSFSHIYKKFTKIIFEKKNVFV